VPDLFMALAPRPRLPRPNENFDWGQAGGGIVAFAKFFEDVAASRT